MQCYIWYWYFPVILWPDSIGIYLPIWFGGNISQTKKLMHRRHHVLQPCLDLAIYQQSQVAMFVVDSSVVLNKQLPSSYIEAETPDYLLYITCTILWITAEGRDVRNQVDCRNVVRYVMCILPPIIHPSAETRIRQNKSWIIAADGMALHAQGRQQQWYWPCEMSMCLYSIRMEINNHSLSVCVVKIFRM